MRFEYSNTLYENFTSPFQFSDGVNVHVSSLLSTNVPSPDKRFRLEIIRGSPSGSMEFVRRFSRVNVNEESSSIESRSTLPLISGVSLTGSTVNDAFAGILEGSVGPNIISPP